MRIITCTRSTILSSISLFTFNLIKHLRDTINKNVKNTEDFISKLIDIKIDNDDRLASLDVIDLFNNVPISKSIDIVLERIVKTEIFCQSNLTKTDLRNLLELCLPMGNVLSPLLADLYMHEFINNQLHKIKDKLFRYVDDLFIITKMCKTELESYVVSLNLNRTNIKFTCEYEENKQINFLDTTITRNLNEYKLDIKWFRKPAASDRFLNFYSRLIEKTIQKCLQISINQQNLNELNNNKPKPETKVTLSLPYVKGIEVLKRKLEQIGVKLYFSYPLKLKSLTTLNIKPQSKSIIYQMNCKCGAIYNGETKVGLKDRMKQHKTKIKENDINSSSEIVKHHNIKNNGQCSFHPNKAFIIDNETNYWKRRKKETIYSIINESINKCDVIDNGWNNVIYKESKKIKEIIKKRNTV
ncbi:unnamed protein product [Rotaria sp. Silwood1]|nr:unnamed protein product [Rotaria sp. Silwood1]